MDIQQINILCLQLPQARLDTNPQALGAVSRMVGDIARLSLVGGEACREFRGDDHGVAVFAGGEPFADPGLGFFVLVVVCPAIQFVRTVPHLVGWEVWS
jgi:hypothetical protein